MIPKHLIGLWTLAYLIFALLMIIYFHQTSSVLGWIGYIVGYWLAGGALTALLIKRN